MILVLVVLSCRVFTILEIRENIFWKFLKLFNMLKSAKVLRNVAFSLSCLRIAPITHLVTISTPYHFLWLPHNDSKIICVMMTILFRLTSVSFIILNIFC